MNRSHLLFVACITLSFAVAASAFRASRPSISQVGSIVGSIRAGSIRVGSIVAGMPMLEPRSGQTATLLPDGKVLIVGGMRRNQDFYKSAELYDPATSKFQPTGEMSIGRVGQIAVLLRSGKVLIAGGWIGYGTTDSAELYDPATGKFTVIAPMTTRRARPSATLLTDGNVLLAGGGDHDAPEGAVAAAEIFRADTLRFQPTGSLHLSLIHI